MADSTGLNKALFEKYAALKVEEKRIKGEIEALNPEVKAELMNAGLEKVESAVGSFTLAAISVWKFSKAVDEKEKEVEKLKAEEKQKGIATSDVRYDLRFSAAKK